MALQTRKLINGLILLLIFLAIAVVAFFALEYLFFKRQGAIESAAGITSEEVASDSTGDIEPVEEVTGEFYQFDDIVINPLGGANRSIVKIGLVGEFDPDEADVAAELDLKTPRVRSSLLNYLGAVPIDILADITTRTALRDTLLLLINSELQEGELSNLYIVDFIRQ
jgi:flagellar basal body-associated protein FliL